MVRSSAAEPGSLRPRPASGDTLNSGPPTTSHHRLPMRAAQITSAVHSVLDARRIITSSAAAAPRPPRKLLPNPTNRNSTTAATTTALISPHHGSASRVSNIDCLSSYSSSSSPSINNKSSNHTNNSLSFVMVETKDGSESSHNQDSDQQSQTGVMRPQGDRSSSRSSSRSRNPTDADWNQYRGIITRLYWDENLSMPVVREYMKREHGFDVTYVTTISSLFLTPLFLGSCRPRTLLRATLKVQSYIIPERPANLGRNFKRQCGTASSLRTTYTDTPRLINQ